MKKSLALKTFILLILIVLCYGCKLKPSPSSIHLTLGNPSGANSNDVNNYLLVLPQYASSYNCDRATPNWVSWELKQSWLGSVKRSNEFKPNENLPEGCYKVQPKDYLGTGYDRGHMIPSGDRTSNPEDNLSTFLMTNMIPQSPANNREVWRILEEYCRNLASNGKQLFIISGPQGRLKTIAEGKIIVPRYTWKIVVILNKPGEEITEKTQVIAVKVPNTEKVANTDWKQYQVSVSELERDTGYNFLSELPQKIQQGLEQQIVK